MCKTSMMFGSKREVVGGHRRNEDLSDKQSRTGSVVRGHRVSVNYEVKINKGKTQVLTLMVQNQTSASMTLSTGKEIFC